MAFPILVMAMGTPYSHFLSSSCKETQQVPKPVDPPDYRRGSFVHTHTHVLEPTIPNRYSISAHLLVTRKAVRGSLLSKDSHHSV